MLRLFAIPLAAALAAASIAQAPVPGGSGSPAAAASLARRGADLLEREDPVAALEAFRALRQSDPDHPAAWLGLGRAHLMLGRPAIALAYAEAVLARSPADQEAMALAVRAKIRQRDFDGAVAAADRYCARVARPGAALLAARASALFRVQATDRAGELYRRVVALDPDHAEAHLRLGSGLIPPAPVALGPELLAGVGAARRGDLARAEDRFRRVLAREPAHPVAHRLLGELLYLRRAESAVPAADPAYRRLQELLPQPQPGAAARRFLRGYDDLCPRRRKVADRALALFHSRWSRLLAMGGRHDLLAETERTTDAPARRPLRGRRTFDGRVWDDVRGIGGLQAATGIEALDEAAAFGFDTLAHELAHQVHYYGLPLRDRLRIRELYERAREANRFVDYYAATNEAEYFGQGVEAFASLGKRPGSETTHGHTRFELWRIDRGLHDLIAELVDFDPLASARREELLLAAVEVALRSGRPEDAEVAAGWLAAGPKRQAAAARARRALELARSY